MPLDPTPRLGLHRPSGGDDADVPADLEALTDQLDAKAGGAPDRGTLEARNAITPYPGQLWEVTNWPGGAGTTRLTTIADEAGNWHPVTPVALAGDMAGSSLPDARVAAIASNDLLVGSVPRSRRLVAVDRSLPSAANQVTMLGTLAHDGATVAVAVVTTRAGTQTAATYELAVTPSLPTTPWRIAPMTSGSGGEVHLVASVDATGQLLLALWRETSVAGETATVSIDVTGASTWTPSSASSTVAGLWSGWRDGGALGLLPIGALFEWPASTTPSTAMTILELAGQSVTRAAYPLLFSAWGIATSTYVLPNLAGRTLIGAGSASGLTPRSVGTVGGVEKHRLSPAETALREHAHNMETIGAGAVATGLVSSGGKQYARGDQEAGGSNRSLALNQAGSFSVGIGVGGVVGGAQNATDAHENMPPFFVARWFVRAR